MKQLKILQRTKFKNRQYKIVQVHMKIIHCLTTKEIITTSNFTSDFEIVSDLHKKRKEDAETKKY